MKPLTQEENDLARGQILASERLGLARLKLQVQLHRDVLNSPKETVDALEAQALKSVTAIEWMEAQQQ